MSEKLASAEIDESRERFEKWAAENNNGWARLFFSPYTDRRKEGRCCKCLCHCPSIDEMAHHANCPVAERIRGVNR